MDCGSLGDPVNGAVTLNSGTTFQSTAMYSCNTDFVRVGIMERICQSDGQWSGDDPTCVLQGRFQHMAK